MKAIRSKNTKPEVFVRSLLHRNGYRFRVAVPGLPGKPDIWMPKWNTVIFVHGCFWHMHDCDFFRLPATRTEFWLKKLQHNQVRDKEVILALHSKGIRVLTIWECALKGKGKLDSEVLMMLFRTWLQTTAQEAEITCDGLFFTGQHEAV